MKKELKQNQNCKLYNKKLNLFGVEIQLKLKLDRKNFAKSLIIATERKFLLNKQEFLKRKYFAISHQVVENRNKISTHIRQQILKKAQWEIK